MASRRMISTRFFKDPDILNLRSKDTQLILIGLVLAADDEGREVAHAGILGREMDYPAEHIEAALQELAANDLLVLYQVGKHRYYQLARSIRSWQTLGGRTTPSRYPAPPDSQEEDAPTAAEHAGKIRGKLGENSGKTRGNSQHFPDQYKLTESKRSEGEGNTPSTREHEQHERKVVPFPTARTDDSADENKIRNPQVLPDAETQTLARHTARILKLPLTEALTRLVAEYAPVSSLSLLGEADAAREWIDDPRRNKQHKRMSPAFFRNWLKREQEAVVLRQHSLQARATGTAGSAPLPASPSPPPAGARPPDLMHLADEDARTTRAKGDPR